MTNELFAAAKAAAASIEKTAAEYSSTFHANQTTYGVDVEILVGEEWTEDLTDLASAEAVRLFDCDGERGATCRTVTQVKADESKWVSALEMSQADRDG